MAFEVSKTGYQQIDPTFNPGYAYENRYHNVGQLQTPYQGKKFGMGGDYGPPQRTQYYTADNPNYPYVLDADFHAEQYLPTEGRCFERPGYFPCYEDQYPQKYVPPDYFAPKLRHPSGHANPVDKYSARMYSGTATAFDRSEHPTEPPLREYYAGLGAEPVNYRRLRVAHKGLVNANNFYPFDHGKNY